MKTIKSLLNKDVEIEISNNLLVLTNELDRNSDQKFTWPLSGNESEIDLLRIIRLKQWNQISPEKYEIVYVVSSNQIYDGAIFDKKNKSFWNGIAFDANAINAKRFKSIDEVDVKGNIVALPVFVKTTLDLVEDSEFAFA